MQTDIIVIGGGAAGLMAACSAASSFTGSVLLLEKMPRVGRKIMITGKGRCNFSNLKAWNEFQQGISTDSRFLRPAFMNFTPEHCMDFFASRGLESVVERGDRIFPSLGGAEAVVDALLGACLEVGVNIRCGNAVSCVKKSEAESLFEVETDNGQVYFCRRLIITTGGLSYPSTGSTGDGYRFAEVLGHGVAPLFPSLTALVPKGYKTAALPSDSHLKGHINRCEPLSAMGQRLCGLDLDNVQVSLLEDGREVAGEFGDISFTDGGIEGPIGFRLSRRAVKTILNGGRVSLLIDLKPAVAMDSLASRLDTLIKDSLKYPNGQRMYPVLRRLLPEALARYFASMPLKMDACTLAQFLKGWHLDIEGYVGYERAVVTAGGVKTSEVFPKTMGSRLVRGLYFAGEVLDVDCVTGGYNLQLAFSTGRLAGQSAAVSLL